MKDLEGKSLHVVASPECSSSTLSLSFGKTQQRWQVGEGAQALGSNKVVVSSLSCHSVAG
jgi:hypothetical protein